MIIKLWHHFSKRRHKQFYLLLILMVMASLAEVISIGAILPFLGILTAPDELYQHSIMQPIVGVFDITSPEQLLLPITVAFMVAVLLAGIIRLLLLYMMTRFSFATGADLSIDIYRRTLYQEYSVHVARNSSEVINGVVTKTNTVISGVITPVLTIISSIILIIAIMLALFVIDIIIALSALLGFGLIYFVVVQFTKQRLRENSISVATQSTQMIKALQEGLGGIRDVLIDGSQQFYCQLYRDADLPLRKALGSNQFINGSPRYVIEAVGILLIAILAYNMSLRGSGLATAVPVLGALALGAQRLLPALQQSYSAYSAIKGVDASFKDVIDLLEQPLPEYAEQSIFEPIPFARRIDLINISFRYNKDSPWILKNINLNLVKGNRIGFMGVTGSGKSTLLDIVMGLLMPTDGKLKVDGVSITTKNRKEWQAHIAHVPQNIFLSDDTIEENIAFGTPKENINHQLVKKVAEQAQLSELIKRLRDGYQTVVGEQGVRLSGGQRQRIGIARALYKKADVLIFDEATSALDNETEQAILETIGNLGGDLTIFIIAHRLSTLSACDLILNLSEEDIKIVTYSELIESEDLYGKRNGLSIT